MQHAWRAAGQQAQRAEGSPSHPMLRLLPGRKLFFDNFRISALVNQPFAVMSRPGWARQLDALCEHFNSVATTKSAAFRAWGAAVKLEKRMPDVPNSDRGLLARCGRKELAARCSRC